MKSKLSLIIAICFFSINTVMAQLYFGPSITHTSTREWDATSEEYTTNDFNFSLYYQFNSLTATKISVSNLVRQGDNRSTEFIRIPVMLEMTIEDFAINDEQLWRLYFAIGGFMAFPVNTDTDESLIDYFTFGTVGEIGMAFNFSRGAFAVIGYRVGLDFDAIGRSEAAQPQRFADSGIQLGFYMPFSIFKRKTWSKEKEPYL
jgi:hypothetical protein